MRLLTWIYAVLALALCLWLALHFKGAVEADPRTLLDEAQRSMSGPEVDYPRALTQLGQALDAAEASRDLPLVEEALLARARLLKSTGGFSQARADLERILTHFRPDSPAVESLLAAIDVDAGDVESGLARATAVVARDPDQAEAWGVRAEALIRLGERRLAHAREKTGLALADAGLARTDQLMRRIGVMDASDLNRPRLVEELSQAFPPSEAQRAREVIEALEDASRYFSQAPEALAESFRGTVRREPVLSYLRVLADAGRTNEAIEFGLGIARVRSMASYPPFLRDLMAILAESGRYATAAELVRPDVGKAAAPNASFFVVWCDVLYRSESWRELLTASQLLRSTGQAEERSMASFYLGVAQARLGQDDAALVSLRRYCERTPVEPFPGATAVGWDILAEVYRHQDDPANEELVIRRRIEQSADRYPGAGAAWLRWSELTLAIPPGSPELALRYLTHALCLLPERRSELEPRWRELGARLVEQRRGDLEALLTAMDERGVSFPESPHTPYELVRLSEIALDRGNFATALVIAGRTLDEYPNLLPAMDALLCAHEGSGDRAGAAAVLRAVIKLSGPSATAVDHLLALVQDDPDLGWRSELVRLDPEGVGRRWAAERLHERGDTAEAVAGLLRVPATRLGDEGRLMLAQLLYERGNVDRAQEQISGLSAELGVLARALPLAIHIGVAQRDTAHLARLAALLEARVDVDTEAMIDAVDHMIRSGMLTSARQYIEALDQRPRWRGAELYLRLAQVNFLEGDLAGAEEALDRALPYDEGGAAHVGWLLLAIERRDWSHLPACVGDAIEAGLVVTPMQYVALKALGERLEEARSAADDAQALGDPEPLWPLIEASLSALSAEQRLRASQDAPFVQKHGFGALENGAVQRDPRPLLARVLALACPPWSAWAIADLERQGVESDGTLWPTYLGARGQAWFGDARSAEQSARNLTSRWPEFTPAWDLIEQVIEEEVGRADHPRLLRLIDQRRKALGEQEPVDADGWLFQARMAEGRKDDDAALRALDRAAGLEPERNVIWRRRAQILRRRHEWAAAIDAFHRSLTDSRAESDSRSVAEFLDVLDEAAAADGFSFAPVVRAELDFLAVHFPEDPLVSLALARAALKDTLGDGRHELQRVRTILDDFRVRTDGVALDDLRDSSSLAWIDFYLEIDPERAHQLAAGELALSPESVQLWRKLSETAARTARLDEAIEAAETAVRMLPDPQTARSLALLAARRGDSIEDVHWRVEEARRISDGGTDEDRALSLATAQALSYGDRSALAEAIGVLARLWATRDAVERPDEYVEVGALYGLALCRRAEEGDRKTALAVLQDVAPRERDATRRNLLVAMSSVARLIAP